MAPEKNARFRHRLGFALAGLRRTAGGEKSFRTQIALALAGAAILALVRPRLLWWAFFVASSALVLALELVNAALEAALDRLHPQHHRAIGAAKDAAAAAVLVAALAALAIGALMLLDTLC